MIQIKVRLFAAAVQMVGASHVDLALAEGTTSVKDAVDHLNRQFSALINLIPISRWAVNGSFVELDYLLCDADVLAMIPPVSGG